VTALLIGSKLSVELGNGLHNQKYSDFQH
jgi:hypothetical protein